MYKCALYENITLVKKTTIVKFDIKNEMKILKKTTQ